MHRGNEERVKRGELCAECGAPMGGAVGHSRLCRNCRDDHDRDGAGGRPPKRPRPKPLVSGWPVAKKMNIA
jgi:hypothetical protein